MRRTCIKIGFWVVVSANLFRTLKFSRLIGKLNLVELLLRKMWSIELGTVYPRGGYRTFRFRR